MGFFRVMINGTSPAPGEVWSVGTSWIGPNTEIPFPDLLEWAENIATAIQATVSNPCINLISAEGRISEIRVEQRDESTEALILAAEAMLAVPKAGTSVPSKTLQTSAVFSLLTGQPGRSYRGRCYWPAWAYAPTTTMRFPSGSQAGLLTGFEDITQIITTAAVSVDPAYNMVLGVRSRLLHETNQVHTLALGDVPDTQRRRRDALAETYTLLTIA